MNCLNPVVRNIPKGDIGSVQDALLGLKHTL
jgi:hypothetical protein